MSYARFAAMIATSTAVMLILMYFNVYAMDHVWFSQTRLWMALLMGASMAVIMVGIMWKMYTNQSANIVIVVGGAFVFLVSIWLVRSQDTVSDVDYMRQ